MQTLIALHAHPDDESSKGAGTVARYSDLGVRCILVTATGGEAGDILNPAMESPAVEARLAEIRAEELAEAAKIIGYDEVIMLGYRDSGMPDTDHNGHGEAFVNQPFDEILGRIVAVVRSVRPQLILGYDDHERYPHPDHLRVHDLSVAAFAAAADPARFPEAGSPWSAGRLLAPVFTARRIFSLHEAMLERTGASPFTERLERFGDIADDAKDLLKVDITGLVDRSRDALRAHRTQIDPQGFWFQVPRELVEDVYPYEDYEVLAEHPNAPQLEPDLFQAG